MTGDAAHEIADTTLEQIGGYGKLRAMVGASNFHHDDDGALTFHFKGSRKANRVRVELHPSDTYVVTFFKWSPTKMTAKETEQFYGVYNDQLATTFEQYTGLYLSF